MQMDAFIGVAEFVRITVSMEHDRKFLHRINHNSNKLIVFDKVYYPYRQFTRWTSYKLWFVTRQCENAVFNVCKVLKDNSCKLKAKGVIKEQIVSNVYKKMDGVMERLMLNRINTIKSVDII